MLQSCLITSGYFLLHCYIFCYVGFYKVFFKIITVYQYWESNCPNFQSTDALFTDVKCHDLA